MPHCVRNERLVPVPDLSHSLRSAPAAPLVWAARRGVRFRLLAALLGFECWGAQTRIQIWSRALGECLGTLHDTAYRMAYKKNKTGWASAPRRVWRRPEHRPLRIQQRWARFSLWIFDGLAARLMHGGQSVADPPSYTFSASSFGVCCARGALGPLGRSSSVGCTRSHLA